MIPSHVTAAGTQEHRRCWALGLLALVLMVTVSGTGAKSDTDIRRFVHSGDGRIRLISNKNGGTFSGHYRQGQGVYDAKALGAIHKVFDAPYHPGDERLSLRLIEFLDHLEDHFRPGAWITITSGYRSPEYNKNIRKQGALAAKASLHQYGMAADLFIDGVSSWNLWEYVKGMKFGGAGYYHGKTLHLDVGPARSWDETTSGVGTGISDDNKLIGIITDYDRYLPGETVSLRFIRMTAFPIGVNARFELVDISQVETPAVFREFRPQFKMATKDDCPSFANIDQMDGIQWKLPPDLPVGRYGIRARFCPSPWDKMPAQVVTPAFEIVSP